DKGAGGAWVTITSTFASRCEEEHPVTVAGRVLLERKIAHVLDVLTWRGAVANGGSWGGCVDNVGSCGAVLKLSNRFFGALAGVRFFFGFRPRLLGIGKQ